LSNQSSVLDITVILAVKNEALNIRKCLEAVSFARRVVVIDSNSSDGTIETAEEFDNVEVVQFSYSGGYPKKRQWALNNIDFSTSWILLLDADEIIPAELRKEFDQITNSKCAEDAYFIEKGFHFLGKRMKYGGFSFKAILLFRVGECNFEYLNDIKFTEMDMEVHERLMFNGTIGTCVHPLIHDDFKNLAAYLERHNSYSTWESQIRYEQSISKNIKRHPFGNSQERRRFLKSLVVKLPFEPIIWFVYHYFFRLGFLEGRRGFIVSIIRAFYIAQIRWKIYENEIKN
jgi:glycosyltransferase involved in cell wall biosynthesis